MPEGLAGSAFEGTLFADHLDRFIRVVRLDRFVAVRVTKRQVQLIVRLDSHPAVELHIALPNLEFSQQTLKRFRRERAIGLHETVQNICFGVIVELVMEL